MSYHSQVMEATGKATCQLCRQKIEKGALAVKYAGFRWEFQTHFKTSICQQNNVDVEKSINRIVRKQMGGMM
jgi:hypothetical protein